MRSSADSDSILVIGEALIDIVRAEGTAPREVVGGSPANVALGLGRLGHRPRLLTALGEDERGRTIARHLTESNVEVDPASWSIGRTATATATIRDGAADYEFDIEWRLPEAVALEGARVVHFGSIAAFLEPGAASLSRLLAGISDDVLITFDPNIRPALVGSPGQVLDRVRGYAALSDVMKLSDEDAAWLWPDLSADEVVDVLLEAGPALVALTQGGAGAILATCDARVTVNAPTVPVADTVGAGDTFMAALVHALVEDPSLVANSTGHALASAGAFAVAAAAVTVQRSGADLPRLDEVRDTMRHSDGHARG